MPGICTGGHVPSSTSATAKGLGYKHQARRKRLLPGAYGRPCPMCGAPMLQGQALDLDHTIPRALGGTVGDRITHASCNRRAGAVLGATRRWAKQAAAKASADPMPTSQDW